MATTKARKKTSGRQLIDTGSDKRLVRRTPKGRFSESDDLGRALAQDQKRRSKKTAKPRQGDKGDRRRG